MKLLTSAELNDAFLQHFHVEVWQDGQIVDYGGPIEKHTLVAIKINGTYYVKSHHEFVVRI
jgi:hypothetical protein